MTTKLPAENIFVLIILAVFSVIGAVGNALVIHVYRQKRDKLVSTVFILTLAVVDLSTCILVIPYTVYMEASNYYMPWDFMCKLYSFFITCNIPFSALVMVAIAVDRYFCICHPFLHVLNPLRAKISMCVLGFISAGFGVITALLHGVYLPDSATQTNETSHNGTDYQNTSQPIPQALQLVDYNPPGSTENMTFFFNREMFNITTEKLPTTQDQSPPLVNTMKCQVNVLWLGMDFVKMYQKVYYTMFVLELIIVVVLYVFIYKSVVTRRTKRQRQKSRSLALTSMQEDVTLATEDTMCTIENGVDQEKVTSPSKEAEQPLKGKSKAKRKASKGTKWDRNSMANIRTAAMLFVVTIVFIVTYLPACLMALGLIPYSMTIFYLYFFNFIANPLIYAFMNKNFRDDLKRIKCF